MAAIAQAPTTVSHETLAGFIVCMFAEMTDGAARPTTDAPGGAPAGPSESDALLATARFRGLSDDIRGCAILGPRGLLAATGDGAEWSSAAKEMLAAADEAMGELASHAHVATEEGEAYAVRQSGLVMVSVTDRFTLASLVLADMRSVLRSLATGAIAAHAEAA